MSETDAGARIYVTRAGRTYEFHADALTAAAVLDFVTRRGAAGNVTLLHAIPERVVGIGPLNDFVWLPLSGAADLVIESVTPHPAPVDDDALRDRVRGIAGDHERGGFVTLHEESTP